MLDFAGRLIKVGDKLAISPSRKGYLYAAIVVSIETKLVDQWSGVARAVVPMPRDYITMALESNGRHQTLSSHDLYGRVVIIDQEG